MSAPWRGRSLPAALLAAVLIPAAISAQPVGLTSAQRRGLYLALVRDGAIEHAPPGFKARIGEVVPDSIRLAGLPASVAGLVSAAGRYDYAMFYCVGMVGNVVLLVEPGSRTIVDVLGPLSGAW